MNIGILFSCFLIIVVSTFLSTLIVVQFIKHIKPRLLRQKKNVAINNEILLVTYWVFVGVVLVFAVYFFTLFFLTNKEIEPLKYCEIGYIGNGFEILTSLFTAFAFICLVGTFLINNETAKKQIIMLRNKQLFDVYNLWKGVSECDCSSTSAIDKDPKNFIDVVNCLTISAALWNFEIIEKKIFKSCISNLFVSNFEAIDVDTIVSWSNKKCKDYLTIEMRDVYQDLAKNIPKEKVTDNIVPLR